MTTWSVFQNQVTISHNYNILQIVASPTLKSLAFKSFSDGYHSKLSSIVHFDYVVACSLFCSIYIYIYIYNNIMCVHGHSAIACYGRIIN